MKKLLLLVVAMVTTITFATAQVITIEDLENTFWDKYKTFPKNGKEWMRIADSIVCDHPLDINRQVSTTYVIDVKNKLKNELYILANAWFIAQFNSGKAVIQMNDKEAGIMIGKGHIPTLGHRDGFSKSVDVSTWVIVRIDIKDEKVRLITTIQEYELEVKTGIGTSLMLGSQQKVKNISIMPNKAYPFDNISHRAYNRETAMGYASGIVWCEVIKQKLQDALRVGITGTDTQDW